MPAPEGSPVLAQVPININDFSRSGDVLLYFGRASVTYDVTTLENSGDGQGVKKEEKGTRKSGACGKKAGL